MSAKTAILNQIAQFVSGLNDNPDILSLVQAESFSADDLSALQTELNTARTALIARTDLDGQIAAAKRAKDGAAEALTEYLKTLRKRIKLVKAEKPLLIDRLPVTGNFPRNMAMLTENVRSLFEIALSDSEVKALLETEGYAEIRLQEGQALLTSLEEKQSAFTQIKGEKQQKTAELNNALKTLKRKFARAAGIAKIALKDNPQQLEKLGIVVE